MWKVSQKLQFDLRWERKENCLHLRKKIVTLIILMSLTWKMTKSNFVLHESILYLTFTICFQKIFRVRTSSRLAARRKLPPEKDQDVQVAGGKSHLVQRSKAAVQNFMSSSLSTVQNATTTVKKKFSSNIGRKTKRAMHMAEKR